MSGIEWLSPRDGRSISCEAKGADQIPAERAELLPKLLFVARAKRRDRKAASGGRSVFRSRSGVRKSINVLYFRAVETGKVLLDQYLQVCFLSHSLIAFDANFIA